MKWLLLALALVSQAPAPTYLVFSFTQAQAVTDPALQFDVTMTTEAGAVLSVARWNVDGLGASNLRLANDGNWQGIMEPPHFAGKYAISIVATVVRPGQPRSFSAPASTPFDWPPTGTTIQIRAPGRPVLLGGEPPVPDVLGTTVVFQGVTWTVVDGMVYRAGQWACGGRGSMLKVQAGLMLFVLGTDGRWWRWNGSCWE